jgi:hypothetical protein
MTRSLSRKKLDVPKFLAANQNVGELKSASIRAHLKFFCQNVGA